MEVLVAGLGLLDSGPPLGRPPTRGGPRGGGPPANQGVGVDLPSWEEALGTNIPTMKHVPKSARAEWSKTLTYTLQGVNTTYEDEVAWWKGYILARCVLPAWPGEQGATGGQSTGHRVKEACIWWRQGGEAQLWAEAKGAVKPQQGRRRRGRPKRGGQVPTLAEHNARRACTLVQ